MAGPPIIAQHPGYYPPGAGAGAQQIQFVPAPAPHGQTQIMRMQMVPPGRHFHQEHTIEDAEPYSKLSICMFDRKTLTLVLTLGPLALGPRH